MDSKKHPKRPRDINQRAASTVAMATGETLESHSEVTEVEASEEERHAAAVTLGRKGGQTRAKRLTAEQRKEIARNAAQKRWNTNNQAQE